MNEPETSQVFDRAVAFFEAHERCPDSVQHYIWLPKGRNEASVALTCHCGERLAIFCTRVEGQALRESLLAHGFAVTTSDAAESVH